VLLPLPQGLLLGVGRAADATGAARGPKVALFDVRDPTKPALINSKTLGAKGSASAIDHSSHGINILQVGPVARVALPASLRICATALSCGCYDRSQRACYFSVGHILVLGSVQSCPLSVFLRHCTHQPYETVRAGWASGCCARSSLALACAWFHVTLPPPAQHCVQGTALPRRP
jgi:hypothetical protein